MEEAGIEQMQNCVLDAADILIDRQPVIGLRTIDHAIGIVRAGEARVVPRGLHKGVEGVGFALAGLPLQLKLAPLRVCFDRRRHAIHCHVFG